MSRATGYIELTPLKHKSESAKKVSEWIRKLRANTLFRRGPISHELVQTIRTDNVGEWRCDTTEWQDTIADPDSGLSVHMDYASPDRHCQNPAERSCGIVECVIKAVLMQNNIPAEWWSRAAQDAQFLLNRLPPISAEKCIPLDGD